MIQTCHHVMPSGLRCQSPAMRGYAFCYHHARRLTPTRREKTQEAPIAMPARLDRQGISDTLNAIMQGLASGRLSPRRAGILLYGLQMAIANPQLRGNQTASPDASPLQLAEFLTAAMAGPKVAR